MISILTPTYNRISCIERLKDSLLKQVNFDFEWIIIDDGSDDNTEEIVKEWGTMPFFLRYIWQENGGKHRAINNGMQYAKGEYTFIVDSDDYLTDNAIEIIYKWIQTIGDDSQYAGISGLRCYASGKIIGSFPDDMQYIDCANANRYKMHLEGDKAEIYRTDLLRQYPFKTFENEKFISEESVWNEISMNGYVIRWFNESLLICEYRTDGLSANAARLQVDCIKGFAYTTEIDFLSVRGLQAYRYVYRFMYRLRQANIKFYLSKRLPKLKVYQVTFSYLIWVIMRLRAALKLN